MTARPPAQAPERLCPRCSTMSRTVDPRCPHCGRSYHRRGPWPAALTAALLGAALALAGIAAIGVYVGDRAQRELSDQVDVVERSLDRDVRRLERRFERELDERFPSATTPVPATPPAGG